MSDKLKRMYSYPVDCGYYKDTANMMVKPALPNSSLKWTRLGYCSAMYYHTSWENDNYNYVESRFWFISYGCELAWIIVREFSDHTIINAHINETDYIWTPTTTRQFNRFCRENDIPLTAACVRQSLKACAELGIECYEQTEGKNDLCMIRPYKWEHMEDVFAAFCPWYKVV